MRGTPTDLPLAPGGVREDLSPQRIPDGQWRAASNFLSREGSGRPRPGYTSVVTAGSADRVIGFGFRGSPDTAANLIAHTITKSYQWDGAALNDITGTLATSSASQPMRTAPFWDGSTLVTLRVNEANAVDKWTGASTFTDATGAPAARDITVCANKVVLGYIKSGGNTFQHRVQWCDHKDVDNWTTGQANSDESVESPGEIMAVRAFGPLSFGVYKEDAVLVGQATGSSPFFAIQYVGAAEGPASPAALVEAFGEHYWLGKNGIIYKFDGTRPQQVSAALARTVIRGFAYSRRMETHGCLLRLPEPELWWWYPDSGAATLVSAVCLNLVTGAVTPHTFAHSITASASWLSQGSLTYDTLPGTMDGLASLYPTYDAMTSAAQPTCVLGESAGVLDQFGIAINDRGTAIPWSVTLPPRALNGGGRVYFDGVRSYWRKTTTSLTVTVGVTITDALGDGDTEATDTFDMAENSDHLVTFADAVGAGKYAQVRHAAASQVEAMEFRATEALAFARGPV